MMTTNAPLPTPADIAHAATELREGRLVAFPTETVYGLGADAQQPDAVARIYAAKGRPTGHPVIVHVAPGADLSYWADPVPDEARALVRAFWPGPLTLILKRAAAIPDTVSGGQDSIGLRCPSHPVAQALLVAFAAGSPDGQAGVAAPSANRFGHVSPTRAEHVRAEFASEISHGMPVLDGGSAEVGIESTIVDLSGIHLGRHAALLRPGHVTVNDLKKVLGYEPQAPDAASPRASGTLKAHYAPQTPVELAGGRRLGDLISGIGIPEDERWAILSFVVAPAGLAPQLVWHALAGQPEGYARDLYAALHDLDRLGLDRIVVQRPPDVPAWRAINDRLVRAGAAFDLAPDVSGDPSPSQHSPE